MEGDDEDPKYNIFAAWKWYLILYHFSYLTLFSTSIILLGTEIIDLGEAIGGVKLLKNVKYEDFLLTLVPLCLFIFDNAFNCTPLTNRHMIFVFLM